MSLLPVIQAAIFDLDGTLIDYEGASHIALQAPLTKFGVTVDWDLHARIVGTGAQDWSRIILESLEVDPDALSQQQYIDEYHIAMEDLYAGLAVLPGAISLIESLISMGCPVAIATSSLRTSFDAKMVFHEHILKHISVIVTGDEVTHGKPAPDIFLLAAQRLGADPTKCVVFEDSPHGVVGAKSAGAVAIAIPDGRMPSNGDRFGDADLIVTDLNMVNVREVFGLVEPIDVPSAAVKPGFDCEMPDE